MAEIDRLAVHERAASDDTPNTASLALADRCVGDAALSKGAVKPDPADSVLGALPNQIDGGIRVRHHDHGVDGARNRAEVRVAPRTFDFSGVRIDREHLVRRVAQLAVDGVGWLTRVSGYAGHSDASGAEKLADRLG
jgi:hypothetical protein